MGDQAVRFLVVATGRDCGTLVERSLQSIEAQTDPDIKVCIVDDASTDPMMEKVITEYCERNKWSAIFRDEQKFALENQIDAWNYFDPKDEDVIVWVDLDDRLARNDVMQVLRHYYGAGAWMTYGSYRPVPTDHPSAATCRPAQPYPTHIVNANAYRSAARRFNHLRTISWRVLKHLDDDDLRDDEGNYWRANTDASVMIPCLELAGRRCIVVPEVLYEYTCDQSAAVWRSMGDLLWEENQQLFHRNKKRRIV